MREITCIIAVIAILSGVFMWGYAQGKHSVQLADLKEYKDLVTARDSLQTELNDKDVALLEAQRERNELRDKEVVKYVTIYRDRIKDPAVAQCVRDSGLLDVYDATVSTTGE